ncbi:DNA-binding response regulator, OmpR family, contains REC and winged-helix (wHTH) domain [Clostridium cavendishii DSM 21758]|uniref:Stage 0 sporulation protein A homolog n=2 Tax=Clostridium TaxID=1485 RepID=A0A1M6SH43_9CLOT|nr:DNA-binding response regulator, OmpR family, contains REC and winged-helix (wHTH) domain [Clostridium cavendishii DSM 21758]
MKNKILIVEDDKNIKEMVAYALEKEGFIVDSAENGKIALEKIIEFNPDLLLLDLMLPDINGFEICKKVLEQHTLPIIMLTAKDDIVDKVLGLEIGADDYITKPFHIKEVIARINKSLQRISNNKKNKNINELLYIGKETFIDTDGKVIIKYGKEIVLRPKEYEILYVLATNAGKVFSREQLLNSVWGYDFFGDARTVDVHIRRVREKLEDEENKYIKTVFGVGYKMRCL